MTSAGADESGYGQINRKNDNSQLISDGVGEIVEFFAEQLIFLLQIVKEGGVLVGYHGHDFHGAFTREFVAPFKVKRVDGGFAFPYVVLLVEGHGEMHELTGYIDFDFNVLVGCHCRG